MNIAIVGSRNFNNKEKFRSCIEELSYFNDWCEEKNTIISGGAKGADSLAKWFAETSKLVKEYIEFKPNWNMYGKRAGFIRNEQIVSACDILIAFWDGISNGTKHDIALAHKQRKTTVIFYI